MLAGTVIVQRTSHNSESEEVLVHLMHIMEASSIVFTNSSNSLWVPHFCDKHTLSTHCTIFILAVL